jgi:septum formation protein
MKIVLASTSPRRREILEKLKIDFVVVKPDFIENLPKENPKDYVLNTAVGKTKSVYDGKRTTIGADTIVVLDDKIIEKPTDKNHAFEILSSLSGKEHKVMTGVSIMYPIDGGRHAVVNFVETTRF